ncbi:S8 family serine peptidase [Corynebacterium sp. NML140438]|uniref:S8 family serine peptidase n=1 Tax=Corynebacterium sp. NML140438 TaxID=1906334 RepID=UPI0008FBA92E|nr:S8 family serine peptidase [Corynebacterium sp. NML140438]
MRPLASRHLFATLCVPLAVGATLPIAAPAPPALAQDYACARPAHLQPDRDTPPEPDPSVAAARRHASGRGVRVAVIDTGIARHPQLPPVTPGRDFVTPDDPAPFLDCDSHGTVVAGIIAGRDLGIAPAAQLIAIRQTSARYREEHASGSLATLSQAIHNALDEHARVINISVVSCMAPYLAARLDTQELDAALHRAETSGAVIVAAAGNATNECADGFAVFPAHMPTVLAVGAREDTHAVADYSIPSPKPPLSARGTTPVVLASDGTGFATGVAGELQPDGTPTIQPYVGTSFAAPIVSGAIALLLERYPHLSPKQIREIVYAAAEPHGGALRPEDIVTQLPPTPPRAATVTAIDAPLPTTSLAARRAGLALGGLLALIALTIVARSLRGDRVR